MESSPVWVAIRAPASVIPEGSKGLGEREAISLAIEVRADLLLADDKSARRTAAGLGVPTTGTLGVLEAAAARGLLDLRSALDRVRTVGLFLSSRIIDEALARDAERRRPG